MRDLPTHPITFEEFLEWCDSETRAEWVNGKVVLLSPASSSHTRIVKFLVQTLGEYVDRHGLGEVFPAPFTMRLRTSLREPDLFFVPRGLLPLVTDKYFDGPAALAIEIISPESVERDRIEKLAEYAEAGVEEYWLIDPARSTVEFLLLTGDARYERLPLDDDGVFRSRVVEGFFLRPEWLWQTTVLRVWDVRRELGIE
jgi:Uma2 family endonuclease